MKPSKNIAKNGLKMYFASQKIKYDGSQIMSHWAYKTFGVAGDSIVSFIGECDIAPRYMVDLEDLRKGVRIYSPLMLHFIIEHFDLNLDNGIMRQRLFSLIVKEVIENKTARLFIRKGDDLFDGSAKLSISVATNTSVSTKIHFGLNIETYGTPVRTKGLKNYKIPPQGFAREVMKRYVQELDTITQARTTVKWVR